MKKSSIIPKGKLKTRAGIRHELKIKAGILRDGTSAARELLHERARDRVREEEKLF
jgi:hypothetical protein